MNQLGMNRGRSSRNLWQRIKTGIHFFMYNNVNVEQREYLMNKNTRGNYLKTSEYTFAPHTITP